MKSRPLLPATLLLIVLLITACFSIQSATPTPPPSAEVILPADTTPSQPVSTTGSAVDNQLPIVASPIRQWAAKARASSEYFYPDWAALQTIGIPDTQECGDLPSAWASESSNGVDWLELVYAAPVIPTEINIYQSFTPGFVTLVEVKDLAGNYQQVYSAAGVSLSECPYVLNIPVTGMSEYVYAVRITVDQTNAPFWNEIDAVELVGIPDITWRGTLPDFASSQFVPGECESDTVPIEMNTDILMYLEAATGYPDSCQVYCLWVPASGSQLDIGISSFDVDLDLFVDMDLTVFEYEDYGQWFSNLEEGVDEGVTIPNPGGRYYIQVCSFANDASTFILHNLFMP